MTRAEAERWKRLDHNDVRVKGGDTFEDRYRSRPVEVDAVRAGRHFVNNLRDEELKRYLK